MAAAVILIVFCAITLLGQSQRYPWQHGNTHCNETMTFCWYGAELVSDPMITAHGNRWASQDKDEKPFEWITAVRCIKDAKLCILARNQKVFNGSQTNIDLYKVDEWGSVQVRAIGENYPRGRECEIDTLILNRVEGSVSMLSTPGPAAATPFCTALIKPKTAVYKLEVGPPKF